MEEQGRRPKLGTPDPTQGEPPVLLLNTPSLRFPKGQSDWLAAKK